MSDQERANLEFSEHDRGVYRENGDLPEICCIYLYFIDSRSFRRSRVYCYWADEPITNLHDRIKYLIKNAYDRKSSPPACGQYLSDIAMRRVSYVVLVTENIELDHYHPISVKNKSDGNDSVHTFCNARCEDIVVRIGDNDRVFTAAVVVNLLRKRDKQKWEPHKPEKFEFFCFDRDKKNIFPHAEDRQRKSRHEHESGGTNMGPPVPPP